MKLNKPLPCPVCRRDCSDQFPDVKPTAGDATVCPHCATVLIFDISLREPTIDEMMRWDDEDHRNIEALMRAIQEQRRREQ